MTLSALGIFSAAGAGGVVAGTYELISSTILGSAASSVTFSSLGDYSSTYKHLQIRAVTKHSNGSNSWIRFNGDSTSGNYRWHELFGNGSSVVSQTEAAGNHIKFGYNNASDSNTYSPGVADILDAYSTTKNTTVRALSGTNDLPFVFLRSGVYLNTAAISSITLVLSTGGDFAIGSRLSLYGIRG